MVDIKLVETSAPKGGPFSPGLVVGNLVYVSGQVGIEADGKVPTTIEEQTTVTLNNIKAIIVAAGAKVENIVKMTVFMTDIREFNDMNAAYLQFFEENGVATRYPTRSTVQVAALARKGLLIEIDCVATL
nr:RidA family protein [Candidatus Sigynarchaeota archaeon]